MLSAEEEIKFYFSSRTLVRGRLSRDWGLGKRLLPNGLRSALALSERSEESSAMLSPYRS
ncbi:MAG TPA: hypothetical protein V6D43_23260 [Candidatus Sericytochromatia bacterium]